MAREKSKAEAIGFSREEDVHNRRRKLTDKRLFRGNCRAVQAARLPTGRVALHARRWAPEPTPFLTARA
jgi:hypothetical protein